jgi:SH3 domain-containing YSC84-like protein 1
LSALLIALLVSSGAGAQSSSSHSSSSSRSLTAQARSDASAEAQMRIDDAIEVVGQLQADPGMSQQLAKAKGVVIVPHFTQAALVFGGRGGAGVFLARQARRWSEPVFYKLGGGTFGAQIGGSKGALVLLLMSDKAVDAFVNKPSTWSMNAGAGLTTTSSSTGTPDSGTLVDVVVWSEMRGLFGGAAVGATRVSRDTAANQIYYKNPDVTVQQIIAGEVTNPRAKLLVDLLPLGQPSMK